MRTLLRYRADLRGRSVDAVDVLRLAFGAGTHTSASRRSVRVDLAPELESVARRPHPF